MACAAFALGVLVLRRALALMCLAPALRRDMGRAFLGRFGPVGVAALCYATFAARETGDPALWPAASAAIVASLGVTAAPLTRRHARARSEAWGRLSRAGPRDSPPSSR